MSTENPVAPARRLAIAAYQDSQGRKAQAEFPPIFAELKDRRDIADQLAEATAIVTADLDMHSWAEPAREILKAHLDLVLTRENIKAQDRSSTVATVLTVALIGFAIVQAVITIETAPDPAPQCR